MDELCMKTGWMFECVAVTGSGVPEWNEETQQQSTGSRIINGACPVTHHLILKVGTHMAHQLHELFPSCLIDEHAPFFVLPTIHRPASSEALLIKVIF